MYYYAVKATTFSDPDTMVEAHVWPDLCKSRQEAAHQITRVNHESFDQFKGVWTTTMITVNGAPAGFGWEDPDEGYIEYDIVEVHV